MERELLLEIGTEEIPASWLPALTAQIGEALEAKLKEARLSVDEAVQTYSTPRRLIAHVGRIGERQADLEELVTGPPVAAAFGAGGALTPAGAGFVKKQGATEAQIERVTTAKGEYIGVRKHQRGQSAVDVLPDVLAGVLRAMSFPKQMRWDATLDDGKGDLPFGRPIRWILYLYGGRVVPFTIGRSAAAACSRVLDLSTGAATYGHRFLTTSGRPGRAIKVKHFDDFRKRLAENFVVLERSERHDRIARELDAEARRRGGRIARALVGHGVLEEVPDLVEYPVVVSGTFAVEFLKLPEEVLTTTMIHHQHFFPVNTDQGQLMPVFLAVLNMQPEQPEVIAVNMERVLTARLRDAQFFYHGDRKQPLSAHQQRLDTVLFHKKLGTYLQKAKRVEVLAQWICEEVFAKPDLASFAAQAGLLCKADLATDMVRELTELQGTMGGIYSREDNQHEEVWKAIYFHYLPSSVEPTTGPTKEQLGKAAITWAAVSLADKLDTLVGMFSAGEKPSGSRDPYGLRRAMNGIMRILIDLKSLTGLESAPKLGPLVRKASEPFGPFHEWPEKNAQDFIFFVTDRYGNAFDLRGFDRRNVNAVVQSKAWDYLSPEHASRLLEALKEFVDTPDFQRLAVAFKRVRNLAAHLPPEHGFLVKESDEWSGQLQHSAEIALYNDLKERRKVIEGAASVGDGYRRALIEAAALNEPIDRFFKEVMVMVDDERLKMARLRLLWEVERVILKLADISLVVSEA